MNKVLFCYTEIAEYFLACCRNLVKVGAEVFIIRFPLNKEAPFQFMETEGIKLIDRSKLNNGQLLEIVNKINPNLIICSGWIDKGYLKVCKKYFKKIPTVLTMDNHWNGNLKQKVASLISPFFLLKRFSHCWVPGIKQKQYALQLGFRESEIKEGFYCANTDYFHNHYFSNKRVKEKKFPKRFLFVGRYYEFKGITDLWNAFIELQQEQPNDWELWCLGAGDLKQIQHSKIK